MQPSRKAEVVARKWFRAGGVSWGVSCRSTALWCFAGQTPAFRLPVQLLELGLPSWAERTEVAAVLVLMTSSALREM